MSDYNGWTNRETWLVNLHFNPETLEDVEYIKEIIDGMKDKILEIFGTENDGGFLSDYVDFSKINWYEIEENIKAEIKIQGGD